MNNLAITRRLSLLTVVSLLPLTPAAANNQVSTETEKEGIQLIRQVEDVARDVRYHAGRLQSFSKNPLISKWSHVHHLVQIKDLVNEGLNPALTQLAAIQPLLHEWKQQSIDALFESARTLAADTSATLVIKSEAGAAPPVMNTEYKELIAKIYEHSEKLVTTSDAAGTYAAARLKATEAGLKVATN